MTKKDLVISIIDNIEGGYYHPDMKSKLKNGERMGISGETMFGIDRKNGGTDVTTSAAGIEFWNLVDAAYGTHHGDTSYYGDKADGKKIPATIGNRLRTLAANLILDRYSRYSAVLSAQAKQIVERSPKLCLQFIYGCYNGQGNFNRFANVVNNAVAQGITDENTLFELVQESRRQKGGLIAEGADKLDIIASALPKSFSGGGNLKIFAALLAVGVVSYFLIKKK